jgi:hypothetical protein
MAINLPAAATKTKPIEANLKLSNRPKEWEQEKNQSRQLIH